LRACRHLLMNICRNPIERTQCRAIGGGIVGGLGAILPQKIIVGGLVVGSIGILLGTWLSILYGREWGHMPTPFAAIFFWITFGMVGCIMGSIVGGILSII